MLTSVSLQEWTVGNVLYLCIQMFTTGKRSVLNARSKTRKVIVILHSMY